MQRSRRLDRRTFYLIFIYGLWSVITFALAIPAVLYLLFPPRTRRGPQWTEAGDVGRIPPGAPQELIFQRTRTDGWKVISERSTAWVIKKSDTDVLAFSPSCTHLGCAYHWEARSKTFVCPCHTSAFDMEGKVLMGPAPRALDRYQVRLEGTKLLLGGVEPGQSV